MRVRKLLSNSLLYGIGDMLVLAVGGFLLLPMYTRTLSQAEFGGYVIVKANTEILQYLLYLGLISAVSRVYFDYKPKDEQREYLNSIVMFFLIVVGVATILLSLWGDALWHLLAPQTEVRPFIWFCLAIATANFFASIGTLWFRLDERVKTFVTVQVAASAVTALTAYVNLVLLKLGLEGLLLALISGYVPASVALFYRLGGKLRPLICREHMAESLHFGLPFVIGYIAYFVMNRFSMLTLQRYVTVDQVAVFGLAQQLSMLVSILASSLGKAIQPMVFNASPEEAPDILSNSSKIYILLLFIAASFVVIFAHEIILIAATEKYLGGYIALLILLVGSFVYSLGFVSNMALLYHRHPFPLAANWVFGAIISIGLGLLLVPRYHLIGGAVATSTACLAMTIISYVLAYRQNRQSYFSMLLFVVFGIGLLALVSAWVQGLDLALYQALVIKVFFAGLVFAGVYTSQFSKRFISIWEH